VKLEGNRPDEMGPIHVLLVDDSPLNRLLIREYLVGTHFELDEAENGEIACNKVKEGGYDLVLMDMRMPVMDGYKAARAIRAWELANGSHRTPIVALTASTLQIDVDRCLDAGCNAYLSKPIRQKALLEAIARTVNSTRQLEKSKRLVEVAKSLSNIMPYFLQVKRADLERAREALERKDYELVAQVGHELKGEGGLYGFDWVTKMGDDLEKAAAGEDEAQMAKCITQLTEFFDNIEVTFTS
jgi:CheY-like chemotaxis protein